MAIYLMRRELFIGILWRFMMWSVGLSSGTGILLPPILIGLGTLLGILASVISGLPLTEALHYTEFGPLLGIAAYSTLIGFITGISIGTPIGIIGGLLVGAISVFVFYPSPNRNFYRSVITIFVVVLSAIGTVIGFQILVGDRYSAFGIWLYPTLVVVVGLTIHVSHKITHWYMDQLGFSLSSSSN